MENEREDKNRTYIYEKDRDKPKKGCLEVGVQN